MVWESEPMMLDLWQEELAQMRAAAPRARELPRTVYGAGAVARVGLIRTCSISPRRRNPAYQVPSFLSSNV